MAEFAVVMPIMVLLFFGMFLAAFYAWRAASADWGVFITGVAQGAYNTPATGQARQTALWGDIRSRIHAGQSGQCQVRSQIAIRDSRPWNLGLTLIEAQQGTTNFRLWRFRPGPPPKGCSP